MKKIFYVVLLVSAVVAFSGVALAAPVKYTTLQQTCINNARKKQQADIKPVQDAFNTATKDALATKQAVMKVAQDAFNAATKGALEARQAAIKAAQLITDATARTAAMKVANDTYNNSYSVKQARIPYMAALKAANDVYNSDPTVVQAKPAYMAALATARTADVVKGCTTVVRSKHTSFFQTIKSFFGKSTSALINAFTFVK